jgi:hypothetical protein
MTEYLTGRLVRAALLAFVLSLLAAPAAQAQNNQNMQMFLNQMQMMMEQMNNQKRQQTTVQPRPAAVPQGDRSGAQSYMSPALQALHRQINTTIAHGSARDFVGTRKNFPPTYAVLLGFAMQKQKQMLNHNGGSIGQFNALEKEIIDDLHALARFNGNKDPRSGKPMDGARLEKDYLGARMGYHNATLRKHGINTDRVKMRYVIGEGTAKAYATSPTKTPAPRPVEGKPVTQQRKPVEVRPVTQPQRPVEGRPVASGGGAYKPIELPDVDDF